MGKSNYTGTSSTVFLGGYTYAVGNELYRDISPAHNLKNGTTDQWANNSSITFNAYLTNNPFANEIAFTVTSSKQQKIYVQVSDITGKVLIEDEKSINQAVSFFTYPASTLSPGMYMVKLFAENGTTRTLKAIK